MKTALVCRKGGEAKGEIYENRERGEQGEKGREKRGSMQGVREVSKLSLVLYYLGMQEARVINDCQFAHKAAEASAK